MSSSCTVQYRTVPWNRPRDQASARPERDSSEARGFYPWPGLESHSTPTARRTGHCLAGACYAASKISENRAAALLDMS